MICASRTKNGVVAMVFELWRRSPPVAGDGAGQA